MIPEYKTEIIVRYAETDKMGSVHHSSYVLYMEAARVEHMKAGGLPYDELESSGLFLPVVELALRYHKPARFGQTLTVISRFHPLSGIRLRVDYTLLCGDQNIAEGHTLHAFVDANGKPARPSKKAADLLS
jgi:acyl-CoA thioester hydrolase